MKATAEEMPTLDPDLGRVRLAFVRREWSLLVCAAVLALLLLDLVVKYPGFWREPYARNLSWIIAGIVGLFFIVGKSRLFLCEKGVRVNRFRISYDCVARLEIPFAWTTSTRAPRTIEFLRLDGTPVRGFASDQLRLFPAKIRCAAARDIRKQLGGKIAAGLAERLKRGEEISFGSIRATRDGLVSVDEGIAWKDIERVEIGMVHWLFYRPAHGARPFRLPARTPNFPVLWELCREMGGNPKAPDYLADWYG